ncbi:MAG: hypothetical protein AB1938_01880 [Myxococcota bacterium]
MRSRVILLVVLCGCGRSALTEDGPASLPQPVTTCASTCSTAPREIATPLATTASGRPLHWLTCGGCVRVTVDAKLPASFLGRAPGLVEAWARAGGSTLCLSFDGTPANAPDEDTLQVIHLAPRLSADQPAQLTTVSFEQKTGRLRSATIEVSEGFSADRQLIYGLGQALGLSSSRNEAHSAMTPRLDEGLTLPGPDDVTTLRAMYGEEQPWCERP